MAQLVYGKLDLHSRNFVLMSPSREFAGIRYLLGFNRLYCIYCAILLFDISALEVRAYAFSFGVCVQAWSSMSYYALKRSIWLLKTYNTLQVYMFLPPKDTFLVAKVAEKCSRDCQFSDLFTCVLLWRDVLLCIEKIHLTVKNLQYTQSVYVSASQKYLFSGKSYRKMLSGLSIFRSVHVCATLVGG